MTRSEFVHRALCYGSDDEFLEATLAFAHDGLDAGDAVLAVLASRNVTLLDEALGPRSRDVEFIDADDWYGYPSRTLGRYSAYCAEHETGPSGGPRRVRIIGEPVWSGRTDFEAREWMRYESLVNVAFADTGHWILCPYDTRTVPTDIVRTAARTHPELALGARESVPSGRYADPADFYAECDAARPSGVLEGHDDIPFVRGRSVAVRRALAMYARGLGLSEQRTYDLVTAVHEAVINAVRYGGGRGIVRLRGDAHYVICEVADEGVNTAAASAPFPGHLPPDLRAAGGHGMWVVRQLSDLVTEDLRPGGSVVRMYFRRPGRGVRQREFASPGG
ncbi:sensor histidine kinase [Streptomyces sp. HC44]|uniref:Sensor histidine kinase n=1 Tax=Streptomyces scabichelini TaxID=2711217 RepID=A0A6G4V608_9ACTN|nr:sensor histidine kinase [Streptomyces scabichelini]NGO09456.1 sensor histidine kinase [Streptomyces scabichelini]